MTYGCHNKPRPTPEKTSPAQDGWLYPKHEAQPPHTRQPRIVQVQYAMSTECKYDKRLDDPKCGGCEHNVVDAEFDPDFREIGVYALCQAEFAALDAYVEERRKAVMIPLLTETAFERCKHPDCGRFHDRAGWSCRALRDNACAKDEIYPTLSDVLHAVAPAEIAQAIAPMPASSLMADLVDIAKERLNSLLFQKADGAYGAVIDGEIADIRATIAEAENAAARQKVTDAIPPDFFIQTPG